MDAIFVLCFAPVGADIGDGVVGYATKNRIDWESDRVIVTTNALAQNGSCDVLANLGGAIVRYPLRTYNITR